MLYPNRQFFFPIVKRRLPFLLFLNLILLISSIFSPNLLESIFSLIVLNIIIRFFFKSGIPLVIFTGLLFQWLQISIKVWYGNLTGQPLQSVFASYNAPDKMHEAFYLSSIGLVFLAVGIYLMYRKIDNNTFINKLFKDLSHYNAKRIILGYIIISLILELLFSFRLIFPGINTIIVAIGRLKWGFFLLFFLTITVHKKFIPHFIFIILFEFVISFSGYFSEFKDIAIYLCIGLISFTNLFTVRRLTYLVLILLATFQVGVLWTAVKGEYRDFLSGYSGRQVVVVSRSEALSELYRLVSNIDKAQYESAIDNLIDRIGFIDFFSLALKNVPTYQPYEKGKIWEQALTFYLKPRILYPNKPAIDDSQHTSKYTGVRLADASEGASHSIGFMTDSYIDFGKIFMHIPIFFLGVVIGWLFKFFLLKSKNVVWGLIFTAPFFLLTNFFSFNLIKVIGNLLIYVVVIFFIGKYIVRIVDPYLKKIPSIR